MLLDGLLPLLTFAESAAQKQKNPNVLVGLVKLMDPNAQTDIFDLNQEILPTHAPSFATKDAILSAMHNVSSARRPCKNLDSPKFNFEIAIKWKFRLRCARKRSALGKRSSDSV